MRSLLANLQRNLAAGVRLALFRPIGVTSFRITLGALLALLAFAHALDILLDASRAGPGSTFNLQALPGSVLATATLLLVIAVIAGAFRQPGAMLALAVIVLASAPLPTIAGHAYYAFMQSDAAPALRMPWIAWAAWGAVTAWGAAIFARALALVLSPRPQRFALAVLSSTALVLGVGMLVELRFPVPDWWIETHVSPRERPDAWNVVTEQALVRQPQLLEASLDALKPQRPGVVDLYYVGFAPYASQDVFRKDLRAAREVVGERFDVAGRAVELVSHPASVLEAPIATASNLRAALAAIGARIDREEDVVMLFLTSHGGKDHRLAVEFFPLRLASLGPADIRGMLDEAGIGWRIIVISACYSGGFIPALADERTLVMTAAAFDRTSFGCSHDSEMTFFADALFNHSLRSGLSLQAAFARARTLVAERERAEGLEPPSDPQISIGAAMRAKLDALEAQQRSVCTVAAC